MEGGLWAPIFHNFTWLCGFENALMNLIAGPEISEAIIRHITDFWIDYARLALDTFSDCGGYMLADSQGLEADIR